MASPAPPRPVDGRGHEELTPHDLDSLIRPNWDQDRGRYRFSEVNFEGVTFRGPISFVDMECGSARFAGATFDGPVSFEHAEFLQEARFDSATFEGTVSFSGARFHDAAIFEYIESESPPYVGREEVVFRGWADFRDATFAGPARFGGAQFERRARLSGASFKTDVSFVGATFSRARTIGPVTVDGELDLDRVVFEAPVRIRARAHRLSCAGTEFQGRTDITVAAREVTLEDAEFTQPSTVAGPSGDQTDQKVRLLSLSRANVANVTLANFDLVECSFLGTHNVDQLRLEESDFARADGRGTMSRQVVVDEIRFGNRARSRELTAGRVADTYRSLRKGREDNKDEPGAADFYYGEMEMRRRGSGGFERAILALYRLVSGYGLRASRALAALAVTVVLFAAGFSELSGFDPDQGFWKSLLFSAESTSSLFRVPAPPDGAVLNDEGHVFQMGLRLLGPLFIGLALLALRARVKR